MISTLRVALNILFNILEYAILIDVLLSWVYRGKGNALIDMLHVFTEPFMAPARKLQQRLMPSSMLDLSPMIAYFLLRILHNILLSILGMIA